MTAPIGKTPAVTGAVPAAGVPGQAVSSAEVKKLHHAAQEFEKIMIHELLKAAKVGGAEGSGAGYGSMAVDALADGISAGGGLGLAHQLEEAMGRRR